jgi:ABC-type multidrug transport system fused ATPase/permease subunit
VLSRNIGERPLFGKYLHHEQRVLVGLVPALVVAHRFSTVLSADRIIVMHKGKMRESGTHTELVAIGGIYRRLHAL